MNIVAQIKTGLLCFCLISYPMVATPNAQLETGANSADAFVEHIHRVYDATPVLVEAMGVCEPHSEIIQMPVMNWGDISVISKPAVNRNQHSSVDERYPRVEMDGGITTIELTRVSHELLDASTDTIHLSDAQRYSVDDILESILKAKEVKGVMHSLRMRPMVQLTGIVPPISASGPHLKNSISNTHFVDALETVLRNFKGVLFYKECSLPDGQKRMEFNYYPPPAEPHQ